jgi:hypothetical protein
MFMGIYLEWANRDGGSGVPPLPFVPRLSMALLKYWNPRGLEDILKIITPPGRP